MTGQIDAAGEIATGALLARAIEPRAGEGAHGDDRGLCLNCGTALAGDYCHACGQAGHVHRTLGSIGHDLLHGVFHFEGKIWRTMPMLVLHPGDLTRRYIAGERARFVSPLALFLFMVFLMFASIHSFGGEFEAKSLPAAQSRAALKRMDAEIAKATADLDRIGARPRPAGADDPDEATIEAKSALLSLKTARGAFAAANDIGGPETFTDLKTGWTRLDHGIAKANANPGLMFYKLQSSAYKYSWALIPISTPFVALLFLWRRRYKLYDHAIFVTYSLAFMMGLVVVLSMMLTIDAPGWMFAGLALLAPPIHMFVQLRGAYALGRLSALWRTIALLSFAFIALTTFVVLLLLMGLTD